MSNDPFENDALRRAREAMMNGVAHEIRESLGDSAFSKGFTDELVTRSGASAIESMESASHRLAREHIERIASPFTSSFTSGIDGAVEKAMGDQNKYQPVETAAVRSSRDLLEFPGANFRSEAGHFESRPRSYSEMLSLRRQAEQEAIRPVVDNLLSVGQSSGGFLRELNAYINVPRPEISGLARLKQNVDGILENQRIIQQRVNETLEPFLSASRTFSEAISSIVPPFPSPAITPRLWEASLEVRIGGLHTSWLSEDASASISGFGRMARLGQALRYDHPFSPAVVDLFDDEFGEVVSDEGSPEDREAAAIEAGFNPGLVAFRREAFSEVVVTAGFRLRFESLPVPRAIENDDPSAEFNSAHRDMIEQVEHRLRLLFDEGIQRLAGGIRQQVDSELVKRWGIRQAESRAKARPVYDLIYYADFSDFSEMAKRRNLWNEVLGSLFQSQEDTIVSLRRLHPIRNDIGHTRPIGRSDQLTLVAECTRILTALGLKVLQ